MPRPRCGRRRVPASRPRGSARRCWRSRMPTVSGRAARSSRPDSSTAPRRGARSAVDGHDLGAQGPARVGSRCGGARRHRREARREQPVGVRRPAVLGRRGRCVHQLVHAGQPARGSAPTSRRLAAWFPAHRLADGGWNCEAEEGDSVALVVPLDAQRGPRHARVRAADGRHRACATPVTAARSTCSSAT